MKLLKVTIVALIYCLYLNVLNAWEFDKTDLKNLEEHQKEIIRISYLVGTQHGALDGKDLGLVLASIAIVETRLQIENINKRDYICGAHQVDISYVKKFYKDDKLGSTKEVCTTIKNNPYVSANVAWRFLEEAIRIKKRLKQSIIYYNKGNLKSAYSRLVYLPRINKVYKLLNNNGNLWLY